MVDYDLVAVIPARLGSSRVERKVLQEIYPSVTLLDNKIMQLKAVLPAEQIVVSTEAAVIAEVAERQGVRVSWREPYFAEGHKASFSDVICHVVDSIDAEHIAWTPCVVPFFDEENYRLAFKSYDLNIVQGATFDSLVSVVEVRDYFWDDSGPLNYKASFEHTISQHLPCWYKVTNGNYMAPRSLMMDKRYLLGDKVFLDKRPSVCAVDIDTTWDLRFARVMGEILKSD